METLLTVIHVVVSVFLIGIVLLQHGKGADMGASFGGGGSQTLFGTEGPLPLLNKITTISAIVFMMTSVSLAYLSAHRSGSVMSTVASPVAVEETAPKSVTIPMPGPGADKTDASPEAAEEAPVAEPEAAVE